MKSYFLLVMLLCLSSLSLCVGAQDEPAKATEPKLNSELELETVTVTAPKEPANKVNTNKLLSVPGADNDPLQAISALPGVTFSPTGGRDPAVRGSSPEDNLYEIDFMPVGYIFHSDGSSVLTDNNIDLFTLDTAAFNAQYNNATGGVIDVRTRSPYYDDSRVVLDLGLLKTGVFVEAPLSEKQAVYFSFRRSLIQYYLQLLFGDDEDFAFTTFPNYYDYQGKYEYKISDTQSVQVNLIGSNDEASIFFKEDSERSKQEPELVGNFGFRQTYHSQSIIWKKLYASGSEQRLGGSHLVEKIKLKLGANNHLDALNHGYHIKGQFTHPLGLSHELQWGMHIQQNNMQYTSAFALPPVDDFSPPKKFSDSQESINADAQLKIHRYNFNIGDALMLTHAWTLTPALAFAYDDLTKQRFIEPRINSRFSLSERWAITTAYGQHHQFKNFFTYSEGFGNPNLKQETATHYELGLEHNLSEFWFWKVEAYYKQLNNLTTARLEQSFYSGLTLAQYLQLPRYTNDAKGQAWGVELFINKTTSDNWYAWLSLAYSRTERTHLITHKHFRYQTDQPLIMNLVAQYRLPSNWQLGFKWRLQSGQLVTPVVTAKKGLNSKYPDIYTPIYGELNSLRLPFYSKVDVRMQKDYRLSGWDLSLYVDLINALFSQNVIGYAYEGEDYSRRTDVKDFPTYISFGLKATF